MKLPPAFSVKGACSSVVCLVVLSLAISGRVDASFLSSYATVNGSFYDLNAATANPDFEGSDLGTFDLNSGDQLLLGAEMNINGGNVEFSRVGWAVFDELNSTMVSASFTETPGAFEKQIDENDRWLLADGYGTRPDVLSGLGIGDYHLQVYLHGDYNGGDYDFYASNNSANYSASFSVIPEPATSGALACLLGGALFASRRRPAPPLLEG